MSQSPDYDAEGKPVDTEPVASDGTLRIFSERLGVDYDAVVERAKKWVAENPLPADLGPEPFNVGKPRPPTG
jgi:hypothetical protein